MRKLIAAFTLVGVLAVAAAGCGGSNNKSGGTSSGQSTTGKRGGTLTVLSLADVDSLDPGYWYYQYDNMMLSLPAQRGLYGWKPDAKTPTPDLATAVPQVSDGGKTITVKIRPNIRYSPPLQSRAATTADIKYAMERCFLPQVGNGYAPVYYGDIVGVKDFTSGKAQEITGIQAPDATTLVLKLTRPVGVLATGQALSMPCTIPVPKDYAQKYDKGKASTYGQHQVFDGPYMIANDGKGNLTGYTAGKRLELVRNPSWDPKTDYRPAYLDRIIALGGNDSTVASRRILTGKGLVSGDYAAPPTAVLKSALSRNKDQVDLGPSGGIRFIGLDTKVKPLDNINVRKALAAVTDRNALRLTRGGEALGPLATHFIPPGIPGYDEAGGAAGPDLDFLKNPSGDVQLAMEYMKKAGYPSGKYNGPPLLMVGDNQPPASKTGEAWQSQIAKIGFKVNYRQVPHATMYSKFCQVPKAAVALCPNVGWAKDFFDGQPMIDPIFNGKNIVPAGNVNYGQANDPKLNAMMDKAEGVIDAPGRAKAWAEIDRLVTEQVYLIPWIWDNQINLRSSDVNIVRNEFSSSWDVAYASLK
jgi:peptide/nickel transport system substrate-binding protein